MKVATASEMRAIDRCAIEEYGIPGIVLMENAGVEVVKAAESMLAGLVNKKITIFAGKGNNGGDGFVAARHFSNKGAKVKVFLLGNQAEIQGDAAINCHIAGKMGIDIVEISGERDWDKVNIATAFTDCLIDALVGTGFKGELSLEMKRLIAAMNGANKPVLAIDLPSGVAADTGQVVTAAVQATRTVTLGLPKPGVLLYPGAAFTGELLVADIGLPQALLTGENLKQNVLTAGHICDVLPKRCSDAHKGMCGKVLVVAGSQGLTGAAALTSNAALKSGAGLVTLAVAEGIHDIMEIKLTEVMTAPLPEIAKGVLGQAALSPILTLAGKCDALALGPGLGSHAETRLLVREILQAVDKPLIIDADGLNAVAETGELLANALALPVLTPHPGEMARLIGLSVDEVNQDRIYVARQAAEQFGSVVVLKGARTIVAYPDGEVYINTSGNAGMATGGAGDVLTGVIGSFIAQGLSSHTAAIAGVYVHGLAGDIAAQAGLAGLTAGDVLNSVPAALLSLQKL
ncbi:NAD(P)H-hydrate dehydratase|uniref:Bifunctional NAD(P)H-hydrate repair enzyme n=1 Tax=Dendrosporobacter quercicolus TaxID=146817 RepID=A0A1G9YAJ2_9FIRM|nr:NAD(P)H-hydrate dehydratase [Dendrosporobacter quercicolus]NSL47572.1 NAD(P)H-hydrate dehydratase [Dendrosporobacter quercicolus DSM 1736]SDN05463.1 NAD(P)H-hydrate epimerase [Dendrosporobacter quercicolus]